MANERERLQAFTGDWRVEGTAYGDNLSGAPWRGVHSARRHDGTTALRVAVRDECADGQFDTLSFLGCTPPFCAPSATRTRP